MITNDKVTYNITESTEEVKIIVKDGSLANFIHEEFTKIVTHSDTTWTNLLWNGTRMDIITTQKDMILKSVSIF